jgi:microcompartment protein CcmK/EutM
MQLGRVLGTVTATVKSPSLQSHTLLIVEPVGVTDPSGDPPQVAVDTVGAGQGDLVLLVRGSSVRQVPETRAVATDLAIVAIVDAVHVKPFKAPKRPTTK